MRRADFGDRLLDVTIKLLFALVIAWLVSWALTPSASGAQVGPAGPQQLVVHGQVRVALPGVHVRACVPLEPPLDLDLNVRALGLRAPDGTVTPAQWEPVVFASDGRVRVAELSARAAPALRYDVVALASHVPDSRPAPLPFAAALAASPPTLKVDGVALASRYLEPSRFGAARVTREFAGPHHFGWVTVLDGSNVVLVDLVLHDGEPGSQVWTFGAVTIGPGEVVTALPEPTLSGNTLLSCGWMRQRQRREFRVALVSGAGDVPEALALLSGAGWGVSDQWTRVDAYGPQQLAVADLSHLSDMASRLRSDWARLESFVRLGQTHGVGVTEGQPGGLIGDYSPRGARYGGLTSGTGIDQRLGMDLALTGEPLGRLWYQLVHRTFSDRDAVGLYGPRGQPIDPAAKGWTPNGSDPGAFSSNAKPFGPPSKTTPLDVYGAIDYQHRARVSKPSQVLAWLDNDPIAKRALELDALLSMRAWPPPTIAQPGLGAHLGRAHGWHLDTVAAARATSTRFRSEFDAWGARAVKSYRDAQMSNGIFQADVVSKNFKGAPFNSQHAIEQTIEHGIGVNGLMGLRGSMGLDVDALVVAAARDGVSRYLWSGNGTVQFAAVRPTSGGPAYATIPAGMTKGHDTWQVGSSLAYWRLLRPNDAASLTAIRAYCGGAADPLAWLRAQRYGNITNREPMMLALQRFP